MSIQEEILSPSAVEDNLVEYLRKHHLEEIDVLLPDSVFTFPITDETIRGYFVNDSELFEEALKKAVIRLVCEKWGDSKRGIFKTLSIIILDSNLRKLSNLSPDLINSPICFDSTVTGFDKKKLYISQAYLKCPKHGDGELVPVSKNGKIPLIKCTEKIKDENCSLPLELNKEKSKFNYVQNVVFQDLSPNIYAKQIADIVGKTRNEFAGSCIVGQKKRVVGVVRPVFSQKENEHEYILDVISLQDLEIDKESLPNDQELELFLEDLKTGKIMEKFSDSYCPNLVGGKLLGYIRKSIILQLVGGINSEDTRGEIHVFLVGDSSTAKSSLLKQAIKITQRSMYATGMGSSKAGLTAGMVKRSDGTSVVEAGVVVMCNGSLAAIDELDKMREDDQNGFNETMEERTVTVRKGGASVVFPAATSILAAANPKLGKWSNSMSIEKNIGLPIPLITRFDLIFKVLDKPNKVQDKIIAERILDNMDEAILGPYSPGQMMKYLNYVRKLRPKLSNNAKKIIVEFYGKLRSISENRDDVLIVPRQLQGIYRYASANAKFFQRDEVTEEDARVAVELFTASLESRGYDLESPENSTQGEFQDRKALNKIETFWSIFKECYDDKESVDERDVIEKLEQTKYFNDYTAKEFFHTLAGKIGNGRNQQLTELPNGRFKKI